MVPACKCLSFNGSIFHINIFYNNMNCIPHLSNDIQFIYNYLEMKRLEGFKNKNRNFYFYFLNKDYSVTMKDIILKF